MSNEIAVREAPLTALQVRENVNLIQEVMKGVMKGPSKENPDGVHFGTIPGTPKPTLFKPGAEVLAATFRIAVSYVIEDLCGKGFSRYRIRAIGTHQTSGCVLGEGLGACSSLEEKYKWRKASSNSEFDATPEDQRRSKFGYNRSEKREYEIKQVRTEAADQDNTILKMACKRAMVAMILNVTAASDIFTQDIEDLPEELRYTEGVDTATGEVKAKVAMPESKSEKAKPAKAVGKKNEGAIEGEAVVLAEDGEKQFISKKLTALKDTDADKLVFDTIGINTLEGLTKANFIKLRDAVKGKK
jgi:hypothetical protein